MGSREAAREILILLPKERESLGLRGALGLPYRFFTVVSEWHRKKKR